MEVNKRADRGSRGVNPATYQRGRGKGMLPLASWSGEREREISEKKKKLKNDS